MEGRKPLLSLGEIVNTQTIQWPSIITGFIIGVVLAALFQRLF